MDVKSSSSKKSPIRLEIMNIMNSCRICMAQNVVMSSIYSSERENIVEELQFCTGIQFHQTDGLPPNICEGCLKNLDTSYKFKKASHIADEAFRKLIMQPVKTEAAESSDDDYLLPLEFDDFDSKAGVKTECKDDKSAVYLLDTAKPSKKIKKPAKSRKPAKPVKKTAKTPNTTVTVKKSGPKVLKKMKFKQLHCEVCDIRFKDKEESNLHKKEKHKDSECWICEICGKVFNIRSSHYSHMRSHEPPQFTCDKCDYKTWHKHDLIKHVRIHTGEKIFQCEFCSASYYTKSNLNGHIRRNHLKIRPFECEICKRKFYDKTKLNRHIDAHNEIKRYECTVCHSRFTRRCYWKKHLQRQHDITTPPQRPGRQRSMITRVVRQKQIWKVNQLGQLTRVNEDQLENDTTIT